MARATIKKYRRKTMKSKSKGKKMKIKKTLKLKPKRRNGKKTQKRFRLKNKKRNVKRGGEPGDELPTKEEFTTYDASGNKIKFDGPGFFKAMQEFRRKQVKPESTDDNKGPDVGLTGCENKQETRNNENEIGEITKDEYIFKFKFHDDDVKSGVAHVGSVFSPRLTNTYCYSESQLRQSLNNMSNVQTLWKNKKDLKDIKDIPENELAEEKNRRLEGYGKETSLNEPGEYFDQLINDNGEMVDLKGKMKNSQGEEIDFNGGIYWNSIINVRTWINEKGVKVLNDNRGKSGYFKLKKQNSQTIIGNLFNVFGMSMLHGQEPGEYIYDIEFVPDDTKTEQKVCPLLNKYELIHKYDLQWDSYYAAYNNMPEEERLNMSLSGESGFINYDPMDDSFASAAQSMYSDDNPAYTTGIYGVTHSPSIEGVNLFGNDSGVSESSNQGTPLVGINRYVGTRPPIQLFPEPVYNISDVQEPDGSYSGQRQSPSRDQNLGSPRLPHHGNA